MFYSSSENIVRNKLNEVGEKYGLKKLDMVKRHSDVLLGQEAEKYLAIIQIIEETNRRNIILNVRLFLAGIVFGSALILIYKYFMP